MLTVKNITKLLALTMIVLAMNGNAEARETPQKARLSAMHSQLTTQNHRMRQAAHAWHARYDRAVRNYKHALRIRNYRYANAYASQANQAAARVQQLCNAIAQYDRAISQVERQLTVISRTPTRGNVVYDVNGQPIDQSWWMGAGNRSNNNSNRNTRNNNRSNNRWNGRGLLNVVPE